LAGQDDFYNAGTIREVRIHFKESNWRHILDSLFVNAGDNGKLRGDVTIDGNLYHNAGIRYKGYSSYNADEIKNPYNIDLDYSVKNQNHLGHVKLKLSNVIHDPSFVREVLSYEIARKYLPSSRANFANLYVNDTLIGLYTNVEAVDANFTREHWGSHVNSFFKGEPLQLHYPFGQNANLALAHGTDSSGYIPYYNMESVTGWNDLYRLISQLDQGPGQVETILNIDRALWMHAFNEVLLNLDSYIGYSQNYYLYKDDNGRFNPILWDLNMSFGSFRDSDGSTHFQGISIPQIKQLDPLALMDFAISPRPLMTKLFSNDTLRKMYFAHIRTIVSENFANGAFFIRAGQLQALIDASVLNDTNRFYSYADFHANLTNTVGGTGAMKDYPGIKDLMESRIAYLDTLRGFSGQPEISNVTHLPQIPLKNEPCWITARIQGSGLALLGFRFNTGGLFSRIAMADDGLHHDGATGDGIFGAMVIPEGHAIQYYIYAENDTAGAFSPERAEYEFYTVQPMILPGDVVLNEFNTGSKSWIELLNTTTEPLNVSGMRLSDDPSSSKNLIVPDTVILAKKYLLIDVPDAISATGGSLHLVNASGIIVDSVSYGQQVAGKSTGRYPNGYGPMTYMLPTRGGYNLMGTTPGSGFLLFPNPGHESVNIEISITSGSLEVTIYNSLGKPVLDKIYHYTSSRIRSTVQQVDVSSLTSGIYILKVNCEGETTSKKLIIY
jgi:hypothetical protein